MNRRKFLAAASAAGFALGAPRPAVRAEERGGRDIIELRTYRFDKLERLQAFDEFLAGAAIPALHRAGVGSVGAFRLLKADNDALKLEADPLELHVLLTHPSAESFVSLTGRLASDRELLRAGASVIQAPKAEPAYTRYESSLFLAFEGAPRVEVPARGPTRLFQLRIYESHSVERHLKKVEMFNGGGEIGIFRRCGMDPVFFGQALVGTRLPNLTYMLGFPDAAAQAKAWSTFGADPAWLKLKDDPAYKDTVSNITNLVLRPAASSEI